MSQDALNPEQFGFKPYNDPLDAAIGAGFTGRTEKRRVRLTNLTAGQEYMYPDAVQHYVQHGFKTSPHGQTNDPVPPQIIQHGRQKMVYQGHHRIAAAMQKGQKRMTVQYSEVPKHPYEDYFGAP